MFEIQISAQTDDLSREKKVAIEKKCIFLKMDLKF